MKVRMSLSALFTTAVMIVSVLVCVVGFSPGVAAEFQSPEDLREAELGERTLAIGSWGADVFQLQRYLRRLGYELDADGLYGPQTRDTVRAFQRQSGLPETGRVNQQTLEALNDAVLRRVDTMDYELKPGDSLWSIARTFDTTMEVLVAINDLPDRPLRVGETIKVPALALYTVREGDTLSGIAHRFRTTVEAIADLNNVSPDDILSIGVTLRLPRGSFSLTPALVE